MRNLVVWVGLFLSVTLSGQEFLVDVKVQAPKVQTNDRQVFTNLETALRNFINQQAWTQVSFEDKEKIRGSIVITINDYDQGTGLMAGNLQCQFARPVYMTDYQSPTLTFLDGDVSFTYRSNEVLDFNPGRHGNNLTAVTAFYCYIALGLDAASFSTQQTNYLTQAQIVAANAASAGAGGGWDRFTSSRNRFWLIEDLMNPANAEFLTAWYDYHRKGMDRMHDPKQQMAAKEAIATAVLSLQAIHTRQPNIFLLRWFFDTKSDEIQQVYGDGPRFQNDELIKSLKTMDASNASKYLNMGR
ncbi:MAG TPA: hypothetical protein DDY62_00895 [Cryomorphaceae bacterium]|jgi:hypothetical protein|nr:hypothetical protein [Cryomorphaceae bacterium]